MQGVHGAALGSSVTFCDLQIPVVQSPIIAQLLGSQRPALAAVPAPLWVPPTICTAVVDATVRPFVISTAQSVQRLCGCYFCVVTSHDSIQVLLVYQE